MKEKNILDVLKEKVLVCDGAMGTRLLEYSGEEECPELWNITKPKRISDIHKSYINSGADIILTNTFGANSIRLKDYGLENKVREINIAGVRNAKSVAKEDVFVAGCIGPTGDLIYPGGNLLEKEIYEVFIEQVESLISERIDLILIETMNDIEEAKIATLAAKKISNVPVACLMSFDSTKYSFRTSYGNDIDKVINKLEDAGADIIGANCGSMNICYFPSLVKEIKSKTTRFMMVEPNAGTPRLEEGKISYDLTPEAMASYVPALIRAGTNIIGGCCGTTPSHVELIKKQVLGYKR